MSDKEISMASWQGRVDPEPDSARWHQRILPWRAGSVPGVVLVGFACDEGVRRNKGRVGAAAGPLAIRKALASLAWHQQRPVYDAGDITCPDGDLESAQARLAVRVSEVLAEGHQPIVLGGGHEVAYGSWTGLATYMGSGGVVPRIGIVNFDAHFDLRDTANGPSSGTPFAQIAAQCTMRGWPFHYACLGISRASNTQALFARAAALGVWVREDHEIRESTLPQIATELDAFVAECDVLYLTLDIDVLPAAEAPGVSAPAAHGVSLPLLEPLLARLCKSGKLRVIDLAELNPSHDIDGRTARTAARLIHRLSLMS